MFSQRREYHQVPVQRTSRPYIRTVDIDLDGTVRSVAHTVHDAQGRPVWSDDPHLPGRSGDGMEIDYGVSPAQPGQPANGTELIYDDLGRVVLARRWADVVIAIDDSGTAPVAVLGGTGLLLAATETVYDDAGRVVRTIHRTYDALAALVNAVATENTYDGGGQLTAVEVLVDYGLTGQRLASRVEYQYDAAGRQVLVIDPLGRTVRTQYDDAGRPFKTTFHDGTVTLTTYDRRGNRIAETDQNGLTTEYEYDLLCRKPGFV